MADVPGPQTADTADSDILKNVPGLDDVSGGETPGEKPGETEETPGTPATITADEIVGAGDGADKGKGPSRGPNDLVDAQGQVVAKGGAERRLYERSQVTQQENTALKGQVTTLEGQLKAVTDAGTVGTQLGLTPEEVTQGAQIMSAYKQNPIETIKYLLTQAQAAGHNVEGVGAGTDVGAIKKLIEDAFKPFTEDRQKLLDTQQVQDDADKVYTNFIGRHPDAVIHQDAIAQLLEKDSNLEVEAAYLKLQLFYVQKGLDWTKPLNVLQKELTITGGKQGAQTTLPVGGIGADHVTDTAEVASVDTSLDDIIKESMREAGIKPS